MARAYFPRKRLRTLANFVEGGWIAPAGKVKIFHYHGIDGTQAHAPAKQSSPCTISDLEGLSSEDRGIYADIREGYCQPCAARVERMREWLEVRYGQAIPGQRTRLRGV